MRSELRKLLKRKELPSAGIIDSQSVKTTEKGGTKGYDGGKKIKGRKRHILVDTQGFLITTQVTEANLNDRDGLQKIMEKIKDGQIKIKKIWADMGCIGQTIKGVIENFNCVLEIVKRPRQWFRVPSEVTDMNEYLQEKGIDTSGGFKVLPRRWVVERKFAWINRYRRMSKEYEYLCETSETMIYAAMTKTMLRRLRRMAS